jgi:hypothetical protein
VIAALETRGASAVLDEDFARDVDYRFRLFASAFILLRLSSSVGEPRARANDFLSTTVVLFGTVESEAGDLG